MQSGLAVIHANHLETLTDLTVQWLKDHPLAPLEDDIFLVQSNGMAQWLKIRLAADEACGISAAQRFQMPARFLWAAYRSVLGEQAVPLTSPFDKSRLVWRLMRLLPELLPQPAFQPLRQFLADDEQQRKCFQLAERLADLFDQYQVYRADWLSLWENGDDSLITPRGEHLPLPPDQCWQPLLWRALIADLPEALKQSSRAHVHQAFLDALDRGVIPEGLPRRLVVFGITSLPKQILDALHALSPHCQVLMLVQNPCAHYWADIIEDKELLRLQQQRHARKASLTTIAEQDLPRHGHPLLAAWGKQGRDYIGLLYDYDVPERYRDWFNQIDLFQPASAVHRGADSLLGKLQQSILDLEPLPDAPENASADSSIRFHLAHSPQREVEILHDQLLAAFEASAAETSPIRPRDVIVMVPDIEAYAPHIDAVFGTAQGERAIPYTISDRSQRHQQPFAIALESLLNLPHARLTVSDLLDLLDVAPLRERFDIAESDLPLLRRWIQESGIRWGLHGEQRQSLNLPTGFEQNSWTFGLKRMLLGYATGADVPWQSIEPYAEVAGLQARLAGQLAALLSTLEQHWRSLVQPGTPADWMTRLRSLIDDLFLLHDDQDLQLQSTLLDALAQWHDACEDAGFDQPLPLAVAREAWLGALDAGGLSQRFLVGRVNFCTLMPMRSIPFRLVCLLGMNDGDYPRTQLALDFDLMASRGQYRPGDRSRRDDDRYLFLEALLASREKVHISWIGHDVRDNHDRPPSVLVAQLRDYLASRWSTGQGSLPDALTQVHPLQPFSRRYYQQDPAKCSETSGSSSALFSYDDEWRAAHNRFEVENHQSLPLAATEAPLSLSVNAIARFLRNPAQLFFSERLKIRFPEQEHQSEDEEPFALDGLAHHQIASTLIGAVMQAPAELQASVFGATRRRLLRSGLLPVGAGGTLLLDEMAEPLWQAIEAWQKLAVRFPEAVPLMELSLPLHSNGHTALLEDWLDDLRRGEAGLARLTLTATKVKGKPSSLIAEWVRHLLCCACDVTLDTYIIHGAGVSCFSALTKDQALQHLGAILDGWLAGLQSPLPLACRSAFAMLAAENNPRSRSHPLNAARTEYQGSDDRSPAGEVSYSSSQALRRSFPDFDSLLAARQEDEPAFVYWSQALYQPLLSQIQERGHE
ncbi:MAG: exodeoxyribonuclease V subunit gamma [Alcanivoracaceae bacterium]